VGEEEEEDEEENLQAVEKIKLSEELL